MPLTPPTTPPTVDVLPATPSTSSPSTFEALMDAFLASLSPFRVQVVALVANAYANCGLAYDYAASALSSLSSAEVQVGLATDQVAIATAKADAAAVSAATALAAPGTNATSATSAIIGIGSKSLTIQAGKSLVGGMWVIVADSTDPATNWMAGAITSYDSGTGALVFTSATSAGSGTKTAWTVSLTAPGGASLGSNTFTGLQTLSGASIIDANATVAAHATTAAIWLLGNYVTLTGTATVFTDVADAPQAGAEVEVYCNATHTFTNNANFIVDGGADFVAAAGDRVIFRAKSTSVFTLSPKRASGRAIVESIQGLALLSTVTASSVALADIDATFDGTYDEYLIIGSGIYSSADTQALQMQFKLGGAYIATNTYYSHIGAVTTASDAYGGAPTSSGTAFLLSPTMPNAANTAMSLALTLFNSNSTTRYKSFTANVVGIRDSDGALFTGAGGGYNNTAESNTLTGVRFKFPVGNINGVFKLYGIKK